MSPISAVFLDLDNCLAPATAVGPALFEPAFEAVRAANLGTLEAAHLERALADCWVHAFDWVATRYGFSAAMREAGWRAFTEMAVVAPMTGYPDLVRLPRLPVRRFLVTSGFDRLQRSKVRALGLEDTFEGILIDAIDRPERVGKAGLFARLLAEHALRPDEVLVVGDNPASEIAAGNRLGIETLQILRPGVEFSPEACGHIDSLDALADLLASRR